jgi:NhaC family Na+:H+ antiporter
LGINVWLFTEDSSYGPNQIALLLAAAAAVIVGMCLKIPFSKMLEGIEKAIGSALGAMLILLLIGSLAGTWMMSGVVPAMIYYGLDVLDPKIFLFATAIICSIVSVATGSSWSTVATVGIALLGIGSALGVSEALAAGAIISGAYFGDKISPLSDTTNLAAAMAGSELITHIKHMLWTTVPSFTIALIIYLVIGYGSEPTVVVTDTEALKAEIASKFNLTPLLFLVPAAVLAMVLMKFDAIVALFVGTILGGLFAIVFQPEMVTTIAGLDKVAVTQTGNDQVGEEQAADAEQPSAAELVDPSYALRAYVALINSMASETTAVSGDEVDAFKEELEVAKLAVADFRSSNPDLTEEDLAGSTTNAELTGRVSELQSKVSAAKLLTGKGMEGMLNTIWLIVTAMCFGGVMEACGLLKRITDPLVEFATSTGSLIATTTGSCIFLNATASDQYLAIVVPGRMFRETFEDRGLAPQNLSRTLEDAGTVTSVLIPWNTCGAAQSGVLGIATFAYAPFCFFNLISPLMTILFGYLGLGITKLKSSSKDE